MHRKKHLPGCEGGSRDVAMLSSQVARLTRLRLCVVAGIVLSPVGGLHQRQLQKLHRPKLLAHIKMTHGGSAIAVGRDGHPVDVVDKRAILGFSGESTKLYRKQDAGTISRDCAGDTADNQGAGLVVKIVRGGKGGCEGSARSVVLDHGIAKNTC